MDKVLIALLIAGGIGVYLLRDYLEKRPRRRREAALRDVATRLGFTYERDQSPFGLEPPLDRRLSGVLPQLGQDFYGYPHVLSGRSGCGPARVFDVWHGKTGVRASPTNPYKLTLASFHLEGMDLPEFSIHPEGRTDKLGDRIMAFYREAAGRGWRDLDFENHPVFSDRYVLHGRDEDATRALFDPGLIALWESLPVEDRWSAAGAGKSLVVYRTAPWSAGRQQEIPPDRIEAFLRGTETIAAAFRRRA